MKLNTPELLSGRGPRDRTENGQINLPFLVIQLPGGTQRNEQAPAWKLTQAVLTITLNFEILYFRMLSVKIQKTAERLIHQGTLNTKTRAGTAAQGVLKLLQGCIREEISLYRHYFLDPWPGFSHLAIAGDQIHENIWGKKILSSNILICAIYPVF